MEMENLKPEMLARFEHLQPPDGYVKTKYLGSGAWKVAFQASSPGGIVDVALLCYHGGDTDNIAQDASKLLRLIGDSEFSSYVARVHNITVDEQNNVWIAEELLSTSLDGLAPISNIRRFCEIARDLSRGITFIHGKGLVHRDLKLDNCGYDDQAGIAKIFDVGSVTSEPGDGVCTILTRAPEFFISSDAPTNMEFRKEADVWALGALLYALRTGEYPFVHADEVKERARLGELLALGEIDTEQYAELKAGLDQTVGERIASKGAQQQLLSRLREYFREGALRLMSGMLNFDPEDRLTADECQAEWSRIADAFTSPRQQSGDTEPKQAIIEFLMAVKAGQITATIPQIEACASSLNGLRKRMDADEKKSVAELIAAATTEVRSFWLARKPSTQ